MQIFKDSFLVVLLEKKQYEKGLKHLNRQVFDFEVHSCAFVLKTLITWLLAAIMR